MKFGTARPRPEDDAPRPRARPKSPFAMKSGHHGAVDRKRRIPTPVLAPCRLTPRRKARWTKEIPHMWKRSPLILGKFAQEGI